MTEQTAESTQSQTHARCIVCETSDAMGRFFKEFGPSEEVKSHFRQSRIEFLKGVRRLLDERIDNLGRAQNKGTRVVVE